MIGESSKNVNQCFKCQDYYHITTQYLSRSLLVREIDSDDEGLETVVYKPIERESDTNENV